MSGGASALMGSISGIMMGVADIPMDLFKTIKDKSESSKAPSESQSKSSVTEGDKASSSSTASTSKAVQAKKDFSPEDMINTGKGVGRIVSSGVGSYMNFTLALAKGFHNAPRLYGDTTVRPHEKISGFHSGLKAAGKVSLPLRNRTC